MTVQFRAGRSGVVWVHPLLSQVWSGEEPVGFVLRPGVMVLSQVQMVIGINHDKYCGTTPACPDFTVFHLSALL